MTCSSSRYIFLFKTSNRLIRLQIQLDLKFFANYSDRNGRVIMTDPEFIRLPTMKRILYYTNSRVLHAFLRAF